MSTALKGWQMEDLEEKEIQRKHLVLMLKARKLMAETTVAELDAELFQANIIRPREIQQRRMRFFETNREEQKNKERDAFLDLINEEYHKALSANPEKEINRVYMNQKNYDKLTAFCGDYLTGEQIQNLYINDDREIKLLGCSVEIKEVDGFVFSGTKKIKAGGDIENKDN